MELRTPAAWLLTKLTWKSWNSGADDALVALAQGRYTCGLRMNIQTNKKKPCPLDGNQVSSGSHWFESCQNHSMDVSLLTGNMASSFQLHNCYRFGQISSLLCHGPKAAQRQQASKIQLKVVHLSCHNLALYL